MSSAPTPDARRARVRVGVGAALILVLVGLGCAVFITAITPHGASSVVAPSALPRSGSPGQSGQSGQSTSPGSHGAVIYVHILGQVNDPGLYSLRDGDRAVDVVAAAGGLTASADPAALNLARFLSDGEQIVVPAVGEALPASAAVAGTTIPGKVNINTADEPTLETLPRVGPAMAARILAWRASNGRFTAVEDLMSVSGIGEKTFEGLKDLVTT
ncbi:MAG: helix-hairpin-helix domain-containing protein [Pseudolysinimonas sp.]